MLVCLHRFLHTPAMSWFMSKYYDRFMRGSEEACLAEWRAALLAGVSGDVLEVGAGTGASLVHYSSDVSKLVLCEPDRHMRKQLANRLSKDEPNREVSDAALESLPFPDSSFDWVVCMLVLCSVRDLTASLSQIARVLRPGGRLAFLEHVAADDRPDRLKWQRRIEPFWKLIAGNCHLTRQTESALLGAGFEIESIERDSIRKANPVTRPSIRGIAVRPS